MTTDATNYFCSSLSEKKIEGSICISNRIFFSFYIQICEEMFAERSEIV